MVLSTPKNVFMIELTFLTVPNQNWSAAKSSEMIEIETGNCKVRVFLFINRYLINTKHHDS